MMKQEILQKVETIENGALVMRYELVTRNYKTPTGALVIDEGALEKAVNKCLNYVYYTELSHTLASAMKSLENVTKKFDNGSATREDVEKARVKYNDARARFNAYPVQEVQNDPFALLVACVITGTKLNNIEKASYMLAMLRNDHTPEEVKPVIVKYINSCFDLRDKNPGYVKPYTCNLNLKKVENLQRMAKVITRKWTDKGIQGKAINDLKLWQQIMLTIFEEAFSLKVEAQPKDAKKYVAFN